ncbi:PREDICTED: N(4)-(Beta-N-acetylglucosaminyl)-L-asparaginase-like [Trachymyrmex cornetzi]|uniref:N(4)-(beta-N-acetylglucosaminyl)-L-asparaginase n=1 Tax=Trachymyrmex cornetzi TaxID=471704 RepID=A0A195EDV6_9HYME|nr:PREDICTED: N(4)-(Beta-N-acetylglucosaminyl)-L-asparaginase-like [Trachymyrmex cornetzi]KYN23291.1 N(4)-(Beta-N-acetylglucosaminyl)-L-asparaginase [Trachymyrmex cornetzi]
MKLVSFARILLLFEICSLVNVIAMQTFNASENNFPIIVITWAYKNAMERAWDVIYKQKRSALDAIEEGCSLCEFEEQQCKKTVGFGGSPDESGETTLDAMIMDGVAMDVGAVGGLRNVKNAISVARKVLKHTKHSLLVGDLATHFAINMGFKNESLQTNESKQMWKQWKLKKCQPNFWKNVMPKPTTSCGPYHMIEDDKSSRNTSVGSEENHDSIGILAIDSQERTAAGISTNGVKYKIPGRVGDSSIAGAGAYADQKVGAAASTGDGDIIMRFLPSFLAVEEMRYGASPTEAAQKAISRITNHYRSFFGAVIALNKEGKYGAACNGMLKFPYYVATPTLGLRLYIIRCTNYNLQ